MGFSEQLAFSNIHHIIFKKISIIILSLSLVIGVGVFYYEMEQIDEFVLNLAIEESSLIQETDMHPNNKASLEQRCRELNTLHFPIVEIYNLKKEKIFECILQSEEEIEKHLKAFQHGFKLQASYQKYEINNHYYLRVITPIMSDNNKNYMGYFEGVYKIDDKTMASIRKNIFLTISISIISIIAIGAILYPIILQLNRDLIQNNQELLQSNIQLMEVLGSAIAKRDSDTNIHNYRVTIYAIYLGQKVDLPREDIRNLIVGSFLHDVGKIGIRDSILLKPGGFTDEEFQIMKTHVVLGLDIIAKSPWLKNAKDVIQYHHEKFDGSGYMQGLKGDAIPINARIFSIVDVFDALTSKRPYKEPFSYEKAISILEEGRNKHFDGRLLSLFLEIVNPIYLRFQTLNDKEIEAELEQLLNIYFIQD